MDEADRADRHCLSCYRYIPRSGGSAPLKGQITVAPGFNPGDIEAEKEPPSGECQGLCRKSEVGLWGYHCKNRNLEHKTPSTRSS